MATIFLDANALIDLLERKARTAEALAGHVLAISPLSLHVLAYVYKYVCPSEVLQAATEAFTIVSLDGGLLARSALGPTADFEDNMQLQSATACGSDYFLTSDARLLKMGVFGSTRIVRELPWLPVDTM